MKIDIETLKKTKGIGNKTIERIIEQHNKDQGIKAYKSVFKPSDKYKADKDINLWQGNCIELMEHIPDKSIDLILCDLPYGVTACSWDIVIPFNQLWSNYKRIVKDNGTIVLFGSEPFSTKLRNSNLEWYKYDWLWDKKSGSNFQNAEYQPLRVFENILVFYDKRNIYKPIMKERDVNNFRVSGKPKKLKNPITGYVNKGGRKTALLQYPVNKLEYDRMGGELNSKHRLHPTQKPVKLLEYLIKTYTNENMVVLDNCMGSGSTGVACRNLNRRFIGIELDKTYFDIARERINENQAKETD